MRCYSHLSDDEREQDWFGQSFRHSGSARDRASDRPSEIDDLAGRTLLVRCTPPEPINCAGGVNADRTRDRVLRTFVVDRLAERWTSEQISGWLKGRKRTSSAGRGLRDDLCLYLSGSSKGKGPSSCGVISRIVTNAAGHVDRDLRKIPSRIASPSTNGPRLSTAEPRAAIGRVTSLFVSAHDRCSFSMSANPA